MRSQRLQLGIFKPTTPARNLHAAMTVAAVPMPCQRRALIQKQLVRRPRPLPPCAPTKEKRKRKIEFVYAQKPARSVPRQNKNQLFLSFRFGIFFLSHFLAYAYTTFFSQNSRRSPPQTHNFPSPSFPKKQAEEKCVRHERVAYHVIKGGWAAGGHRANK